MTSPAVLVLALLSAPTPAQTPSFPAGTELVTVDAVVQDRDGKPVLGLSASDFTLLEDGVPQQVVAFEAVNLPERPAATAGTPLPPGAQARTSSNVDAAAQAARSFVVVFDERHLDLPEAARGKRALARFLDTGPRAGDRVTLTGTQTGAGWTARLPEGRAALLQVLDGLQGRRQGDLVRDAISDYEAMRIDRETDWIVIDRVTRRLVSTNYIRRDAVLPGDPRDTGANLEAERGITQARAAQVYAKATLDNEATLSVIERGLSGLSAGHGRKSLILVSGGFIHDPHIDSFRRAVSAARRANVALYFVDARGLTGMPSAFQADVNEPTDFNDLGSTLAEARNDSEGSESLAADTGGFSVRDNDLALGLERIERESTSYYLLGYKPTNTRADGRFRKIVVRVGREGVRVGARRGYYAPEANPKTPVEGRDAGIQRTLDSPFELSDLGLRATHHVFGEAAPHKQVVVLTAEADIRSLAFEARGATSTDTLETMLVVTNRDTAEFFRFDQQFEMSFRPETRSRYERSWFPIRRRLELAPGAYQAKVIVRDKNSGRIGSLTHDFEVPEGAGLRISTPILGDHLREDGPEAPVLEPTARREFAPAGVLHCHFEVYGAAPDKGTGKPSVTAGFSIRRSDGRFLAAGAETPLRPGADGGLSRSFGAEIQGAPPGRYEMIILATDLAAGQVAEIREPFVIEAPATN
jgi:VWFA-related protein